MKDCCRLDGIATFICNKFFNLKKESMKNLNHMAGFTKLILLALVFTGTITAANAQKCKFDFDKKDPMSGDRVRRNTHKVNYGSAVELAYPFYTRGAMAFSFYRNGDDFKLEANGYLPGLKTYTVQTSDQLQIKLGNGEIISVYANNEFKPTVGGQGITLYAISYDASQEVFQKIATHGVVLLRVYLGSEMYDVEVKDKMLDKMKAGAACMLTD